MSIYLKGTVCAGLFLTLSGTLQAQSNFEWPQITNNTKPWTRWWWMGNAVDTAGLSYNLEAFSKAGIGGVEITPIYGVDGFEKESIDFLSPEWMKMLDFTMSKADQLGMKVDMNNGTGWPFGGPMISTEDAASKVIFQTYQVDGSKNWDTVMVAKDPRQSKVATLERVMAYGSDGRIEDITSHVKNGRIQWKAPKGGWKK